MNAASMKLKSRSAFASRVAAPNAAFAIALVVLAAAALAGCGSDAADDCARAAAPATPPNARALHTLDAIACAAGIVRACPMPACTAPPYPASSGTCRDYIDLAGCGGCQFYACREAEHSCGASGYYVAYAEKYCVRFLQVLRPRMSPAGQRFLDVARDCLMRYVDTELPAGDVCDDVKERAFQSH